MTETTKLRIAIIQFNPLVGDIDGNARRLVDAYRAAAPNADLVVAPECALTGYPLEDLVLRQSFMRAVQQARDALHVAIAGCGFDAGFIYGAPRLGEDGKIHNSAFLVSGNDELAPIQVTDKVELPNYGVFDEKRVFAAGSSRTFDFRGLKIGVPICEDFWFPRVSLEHLDRGAQLLIAINGSPFEVGKNVTRRKVAARRIRETGIPIVYANLVGGQDELVFDGESFAFDRKGIQSMPAFTEAVEVFALDVPDRKANDLTLENYPRVEPTGVAHIYRALVTGTRDYIRKQRFKSVVIGMSGGVDSGLVAAIACDAIGPENVHLVRLPSRFSSEGSLTDAQAAAERLGAPIRTIAIEPIVEAIRYACGNAWTTNAPWALTNKFALQGVADENIQARARGIVLMGISNNEGRLLLTTGNKSEVSVGYATLYGDMCGGFNPLKDLYKTIVWNACRWRNALTKGAIAAYGFEGPACEVVPEAIISKPPSAELRPDQKDEDSLPPYPMLDLALNAMIECELSVDDIVGLGIEREIVVRVRNLVDLAEYKRRQAAPGVKITSRLYGRDRRYPIVNYWRA